MEEQTNIYILLDLDPSVDDAALIEATIATKRQTWSKQQSMGNPSQQAEAKRNIADLGRIRSVMADPETRRKEAAGARKQIEQRRKESIEQLNLTISLLRLAGSCSSDALAKLVKQFVGRLTEKEITDRLHSAGITIDRPEASRNKRTGPGKERIDAARMNQIRPSLEQLRVKDLYDFLKMDRNSSARSLQECADKRNKRLLDIGKNDVESSTAKALCGQCMAIFADDKSKEKYDNTLAVEAMEAMRPRIELVASGTNFLTIEQQDELMKQARLEGVSAADAADFLKELASKRNWKMQTGKSLPSEKLRQCGHCLNLASAKASHCNVCGRSLSVTCPRCDHIVPTEHAACTNCGFRIGDWSWVKKELDEADQLVKSSKLDEAIKQLENLATAWPDWKIILPRLADAREAASARQQDRSRLEALVREGKYLAAQAELERFRKKWTDQNTGSIYSSIQNGIVRAQKAFDEAERKRQQGRTSDAVAGYRDSLRICKDFEQAHRALATLPPVAPGDLVVTSQANGFQLRWTPQDKTVDGYQIVRRANAAPLGPDDGAHRLLFKDVTGTDPDVEEGIPWHYAAFSQRDGVFSVSAARSGPHLRVAPVRDLLAKAGDREIRLTWVLPKGALGVEIWRRQGAPPDRPGVGTRLTASGNSFHDSAVANDTVVGYLVLPLFSDPQRSGATVPGPSQSCSAVPTTLPAPVTDLVFARERGGVRLSWTSPAAPSQVRIRQINARADIQVGSVLAKEQVDALGISVLATAPGAASIPLPGVVDTWFVPMTIKNTLAVVGKPINVVLMEGLSEVRADHDRRAIHLQWKWPVGCTRTSVCYSYDAYPEAPGAAGSQRQDVGLDRYRRDGMFTLHGAERRAYYFSLFAITPDGRHFSEPAKRLVQLGEPREVRYRIAAPQSLLARFGSKRELEVHGFGHLPETILVAKARVVPTRPDDGEELMRIPEMDLAGTHRISIPVNLSGSGNMAKLFFADANHIDEIKLISGPLHELKL